MQVNPHLKNFEWDCQSNSKSPLEKMNKWKLLKYFKKVRRGAIALPDINVSYNISIIEIKMVNNSQQVDQWGRKVVPKQIMNIHLFIILRIIMYYFLCIDKYYLR